MTTLSIAEAMGVKESTVETYAKRAFAKLGLSSRRGLLHGHEAITAAQSHRALRFTFGQATHDGLALLCRNRAGRDNRSRQRHLQLVAI
ncbi:hypothetical protein FSO04_07395 [Paraburkholderia madseniana]|uniref:HTH luxR-type domain-containing protein n=1 Tax=Paraburkholderia madseniana TaxID=2599607 RepID=A0A6N6WJ81_9BURK|nr:hypothetical protein FSO04_07395 [Paraburkholderia madseniana]NPT67863.1 hypothetical protein [Paraburkholderia madseniana]